MKAVAILFIISAIALGANAQEQLSLQQIVNECKSGAQSGIIENKCVEFCIATKMGLMNKDGSVDPNFIRAAIKTGGEVSAEQKEMLFTRLEQCVQNAKSSDVCETGRKALDCLMPKKH